MVNAHLGANLGPKLVGELRATIGDDNILYAMLADCKLEKHAGKLRWVDIIPAAQENHYFGQSVDNYQHPRKF